MENFNKPYEIYIHNYTMNGKLLNKYYMKSCDTLEEANQTAEILRASGHETTIEDKTEELNIGWAL